MKRRYFIKSSAIMTTGIIAKSIIPISNINMEHKPRSVYKVLNPSTGGLGSMKLKNIIQGDYQNYVSPFFLLDEFGPMKLPAGTPFRVDAHPHAGIIPTTYLLEGCAHHRDSMDNDFEYKSGDFILFTSGKGALHMEETGEELYKNGGVFHGFQGWLNIPAKLKKSEPYSTHIKSENIEVVENGSTKIKVILGEVFGTKSKSELLMPVIYWHVSMKENSILKLPVDIAQNVFIYLKEGQLQINENQHLVSGQTVLFERDGDCVLIKATTKAEFLVLGGQVNNETYVANGPFVLNNEQEIMQAYNDFRMGRFGDLAKTNGIKR